MGSSTQTPDLGLSQFADGDRPTWRGDYNGDMLKIDTYARYTAPLFYAEKFTPGNTDLEALHAACAAATTFATGAIVQLSSRTWDVGTGMSMSGYSCGIEGLGVGCKLDGTLTGSVLYASTQSGAVLDFTDWISPDSFRGMISIGGFGLRGSNVADPTKNNAGLKRSTVALGSVNFHDISITQTGGPCIDLFRLYLGQINRVVCVTPVGAKVNDVPYAIFRGCNDNIITGLGFRSMVTSGDTGISGALIVTDDGGLPSSGNIFNGTWFEFLHIPTNGTLINVQGNTNVFNDFTFPDVSCDGANTNTSYWSLNNVVHGPSTGGNIIRGMIPGKQGTGPSTGVIVNQNYNRIEGVKGYDGFNVTLSAGVQYTFASLGGAVSGASLSAFVDNSGNTTNVLLDYYNRSLQLNDYVQTARPASGQSGPRFADTLTPANGSIYIGNTGVREVAIGGTAYHDGDTHVFRDTTGAITYADITPARGLHVYSGISTAVRIITASTSATTADSVIIANGANIAVTLMSATTGAGTTITIKNINATACTVNALAGQNIDGGSNTETLAQWAVSRYVSTGTAWVKV